MIKWPGSFYRTDIGAKAARHMKKTKAEARKAQVGIVMGSDSDLPVMQAAADFLLDRIKASKSNAEFFASMKST